MTVEMLRARRNSNPFIPALEYILDNVIDFDIDGLIMIDRIAFFNLFANIFQISQRAL